MKKLDGISRKWWFFLLLLLAQLLLIPFAGRNFNYANMSDLISTTLQNAFQMRIGEYNIYFQGLSLLMLLLLVVFRNRVRRVFDMYVAVCYIAFTFLQNMAVTERYGLSIVTVNVVMFLFVAYVWASEAVLSKNDYSFSNVKWKYSWMILFSLFAYVCPFSFRGAVDLNPLNFFDKNSATSFCLMTPLFLTIMTLNLPRINIVTYRITAIIGVIIGLYNMLSFLNPYTVFLGILHIPLLSISLYCALLSYRKMEEY